MKSKSQLRALPSLNDIVGRFENYLVEFKRCSAGLPATLSPCQSKRPSILLTNLLYQVNWVTDYQEEQYVELKALIEHTLDCGDALLAQITPSNDDKLDDKLLKLQYVGDSDLYDTAYHYFTNLICLSLLSNRTDKLLKSLCYYQRIPFSVQDCINLSNRINQAGSRSVVVGLVLETALADLVKSQNDPEKKQALKDYLEHWDVKDILPETEQIPCLRQAQQLLIMKHRLKQVAIATNGLIEMGENPVDSDLAQELAVWLKQWDAGEAKISDVQARVFDHLVAIGKVQSITVTPRDSL